MIKRATRFSVKPALLAASIAMALFGSPLALQADETCQSPYMAKITGQEDFFDASEFNGAKT